LALSDAAGRGTQPYRGDTHAHHAIGTFVAGAAAECGSGHAGDLHQSRDLVDA
jgi:hypothetical protein